jgi:hypothetical protein
MRYKTTELDDVVDRVIEVIKNKMPKEKKNISLWNDGFNSAIDLFNKELL